MTARYPEAHRRGHLAIMLNIVGTLLGLTLFFFVGPLAALGILIQVLVDEES